MPDGVIKHGTNDDIQAITGPGGSMLVCGADPWRLSDSGSPM